MTKLKDYFTREKILLGLSVLFWILLGTLVIASVHSGYVIGGAYQKDISPLPESIPRGLMLIAAPFLSGLILSIVLIDKDLEPVHVLYCTNLMAILSIFLLMLILVIPSIIGNVEYLDVFSIWVIQKMMTSFLLVFPFSLIGGTVGVLIETY